MIIDTETTEIRVSFQGSANGLTYCFKHAIAALNEGEPIELRVTYHSVFEIDLEECVVCFDEIKHKE